MLDQSFSVKCLKHILKKEDVKHFRLWNSSDPEEDKDNKVSDISNKINSPSFCFPSFREKITKGKTIYSVPDATTLLLLRKLDRNIRAIYKVKQANRDEIIHQVKSLLKEGCFYSVLRLDISSYHEVAKVKEDVFNIVTNFGLELNQHKERSIECYNGTIKKNSDLFKGYALIIRIQV